MPKSYPLLAALRARRHHADKPFIDAIVEGVQQQQRIRSAARRREDELLEVISNVATKPLIAEMRAGMKDMLTPAIVAAVNEACELQVRGDLSIADVIRLELVVPELHIRRELFRQTFPKAIDGDKIMSNDTLSVSQAKVSLKYGVPHGERRPTR